MALCELYRRAAARNANSDVAGRVSEAKEGGAVGTFVSMTSENRRKDSCRMCIRCPCLHRLWRLGEKRARSLSVEK